MKECGSCSMCCKVMGIRELAKPRNTWCSHVVKGKGCGIYETRPGTCRQFECVWLKTDTMPDNYRPDKLHAVIVAEGDNIIIHLDPGYPTAHRQEPLAGYIDRVMALDKSRENRVNILVVCGKTVYSRMGKSWVAAKSVEREGDKINATFEKIVGSGS